MKQAQSLMRACLAATVLTLAGGIALLFGVEPVTTEKIDVIPAAQREITDAFYGAPQFAALISAQRTSPFEFDRHQLRDITLRPVVVAPTKTETKSAPPPPPPPKPDIQGLALLGSMPGERISYALISDSRQGGVTLVVTPGQSLRNAQVEQVLPDRVIVALGEQRETLRLPKVRGSLETAEMAKRMASDWGWIAGRSEAGVSPLQAKRDVALPNSAMAQENPRQTLSLEERVRSYKRSQQSAKSLGIAGRLLSRQQAREQGLAGQAIEVTSVKRAQSPFQSGDLIVKVGGEPVVSLWRTTRQVRASKQDQLVVSVLRNGEQMTLTTPLVGGAE
ncbi:hypothetical protein [Magnetofaba australis]|nr:hypothetical protein [Magnetofaba australis]